MRQPITFKKHLSSLPVQGTLVVAFFCLALTFGFWNACGSESNVHYTYCIGVRISLPTVLASLLCLPILIIPMILFWQERRKSGIPKIVSSWSVLLMLALIVGSTARFSHLLLGAFFVFLLVYSISAYFFKGNSGPHPKGWFLDLLRHSKWYEKLYLLAVIACVAPIAQSLFSHTYHSIFPMQPGQPEFRVQFERDLTAETKRASYRFPDAQSCLASDASAEHREDLLRMNWDEIATSSEAEVCMFRLLSAWGGVSEAQTWLETQGFRVWDDFSSANPMKEQNGTLRVGASWSIKEFGPRFPTTGVIRRIVAAGPYSMSVNATFSPDGQDLLFLKIGYSVF